MTAPSAEETVRLAKSEDLPDWGRIQAQAMQADLQSHLGQIGPQTLAFIDPEQITRAWQQALFSPPSPKHHLLTAINKGQVVGMAAIAPAPKMLVQPNSPRSPKEMLMPKSWRSRSPIGKITWLMPLAW